MLEWLRRRKQTPRAIERFWRVVLVSALDEELDRTDARFGIDVFWKAFLTNRTGYRMGVPIRPARRTLRRLPRRDRKKGRGSDPALAGARPALRKRRAQAGGLSMAAGKNPPTPSFSPLPHDRSPNFCPRKFARANPSLAQSRKIKSLAHHRRPFLVRPRSDERAVHHACSTPTPNGSSTKPRSTAEPCRTATASENQANTSSWSSAPPTTC